MKKQRENLTIQKYIKQFEPLAKQYASKVFNYERTGYEKSDIVQEFRIKIYTSLLAYGQKWAEFKRTGRYKPVPLEYYIKTAMVNKFKDLVKQFNQNDVSNVDKVSFEGVDIGEHNTMESDIDMTKLRVVINEVDCLEELKDKNQKRCFILYLKGFTITELKKLFQGKFNAETVIHQQLDVLRGKKQLLMDYSIQQFETYQVVED
jgi:DNA-directed RNA polymerase specialized sigma24 family protein